MAKKKRSSKLQHARPCSVKPGGSVYDFEDGDGDGDSMTAHDVQSLCSSTGRSSSRDTSSNCPGNGDSEESSEGGGGSLLNDYDDFEEKLDALLDGLHLDRKGALKTRLGQLTSLSKAMATRFCAEYFTERQLTMLEIVERSLKRSEEEADCAALVLSALLITMAADADDFCEHLFPPLYEPLLRLLADHTAKPSARASCALALSLGVFITHFGTEKADPVMRHLIAIVSSSPVRGSSGDPTALYALKTTCLTMFSFLASDNAGATSTSSSSSLIHQLKGCFEAPHLPLRVAAGQCVALLFEQHNYDDDEEEDEEVENTLNTLKAEMSQRITALATDSQKSRSKKELREQRAAFRQVLATLQGEHFHRQTVTIAGQQQLAIDCWQWKHLYDAFCGVLGSGMRLHLSENPFLREVFDLGPVPLLKVSELPPPTKASKLEKHLINSSNRRAREMGRNKVRGKKAAELHRWD